MKVIFGATRLVLITHHLVFKVPRMTGGWYTTLAGLISNLNEAIIWRENRGDDRLCPLVLAVWGGWLNVMRYAMPVPPALTVVGDVSDLTLDAHPENFGFYDGRVVLIDYA